MTKKNLPAGVITWSCWERSSWHRKHQAFFQVLNCFVKLLHNSTTLVAWKPGYTYFQKFWSHLSLPLMCSSDPLKELIFLVHSTIFKTLWYNLATVVSSSWKKIFDFSKTISERRLDNKVQVFWDICRRFRPLTHIYKCGCFTSWLLGYYSLGNIDKSITLKISAFQIKQSIWDVHEEGLSLSLNLRKEMLYSVICFTINYCLLLYWIVFGDERIYLYQTSSLFFRVLSGKDFEYIYCSQGRLESGHYVIGA